MWNTKHWEFEDCPKSKKCNHKFIVPKPQNNITQAVHWQSCNLQSWHNFITLESHLTSLQSASQHLFNVMNFLHFEKNTNDPATSSKFFLMKKRPKFDRFWKLKLRIVRFLHYALVGSHKIEGTYEPRRNIMPCGKEK